MSFFYAPANLNDFLNDRVVKHLLAELGRHDIPQKSEVGLTIEIKSVLWTEIISYLQSNQPKASPQKECFSLDFNYTERNVMVTYGVCVEDDDSESETLIMKSDKDEDILAFYHENLLSTISLISPNSEGVRVKKLDSCLFDLSSIPPRIVCAANRYRDDDLSVNRVILGVRHLDAFMHESLESTDFHQWERGEIEEGFIDQRGNFYDRNQAWFVAELEHQIKRRVGGDNVKGGTLYSENLY